ncbi:MAG TPA: helix-turn-helix domain-containing protein [Alphaproteobacteria bacterium]
MRNSLATEKCLVEKDGVASVRECPAFLALSLIANKWSIRILHLLLSEPGHTLRFSGIQKALDNITQRELTKQLREFERSGLVARKVYPVVPPRVEYTLTKLGHSLMEPVGQLSDWAAEHAAAIQKNRTEFEKKKSKA